MCPPNKSKSGGRSKIRGGEQKIDSVETQNRINAELDELRMQLYEESRARQHQARLCEQVRGGIFVPKHPRSQLHGPATVLQRKWRTHATGETLPGKADIPLPMPHRHTFVRAKTSARVRASPSPTPHGPSPSLPPSLPPSAADAPSEISQAQLEAFMRALHVAVNAALRISTDAANMPSLVGELLLGERDPPSARGLAVPGGVRARTPANELRVSTPRGLSIEASVEAALNAAAASHASDVVRFVGNFLLGRSPR